MAAVALGMRQMDPELNLAGIILNQVGGSRHRRIASQAIEKYAGIDVLGAIPRMADKKLLPSRHLGLVTPIEYGTTSEIVNELGRLITENVDLNRIIKIAQSAPKIECAKVAQVDSVSEGPVRIGYISDSAFTFYYPENLEILEAMGAELVAVSSLSDTRLPDLQGLYIGGGFPETHADKLAQNRSLMAEIKTAAERGLPIYAECGGLIYLCRSLRLEDKSYSMAGVFDIDLAMAEKPQGHGYSLMSADRDNPYYPQGYQVKGHEFHYTYPISEDISEETVLKVAKGSGIVGKRDGLLKHNVFAAYLHVHALGEKIWAKNLLRLAYNYKHGKLNSGHSGGAQLFRRKAV
jgi:cobyrinic acid a,c-diamide synthase